MVALYHVSVLNGVDLHHDTMVARNQVSLSDMVTRHHASLLDMVAHHHFIGTMDFKSSIHPLGFCRLFDSLSGHDHACLILAGHLFLHEFSQSFSLI